MADRSRRVEFIDEKGGGPALTRKFFCGLSLTAR